ncbi:MAG TPA: hypothetical protein VFE62_25860 [Gemmataceae bacterium]|nr:hypothetical protein [Gemmataceae bacterium]
MDAIVVRCKMCKHPMKFSAEKAGKRAKCPKCDAIVLVQAEPEKKSEPAPENGTPAPAAPSQSASSSMDDDGDGGYGVLLDPEMEEIKRKREEEEAAKARAKKDRKKLPKVTRKIKAIPDAESWEKVRIGMLLVMIGAWIWLFCHLMQGSYVVLGSVELPEFANLMVHNLEERKNPEFPEMHHGWDLDEMGIYLGMIAGRDFLSYASGCVATASILYIFQALLCMGGYGLCMMAPRRNGMLGQLIAAMVLAFFNLVVVFTFKLLPAIGAHNYVMISYVTPEIPMTEYNMERIVPIHVLWSGAPFWENFVTIMMRLMQYFEPALFCVFVWSAGLVIKDKTVENGGHGRAQLCLGAMFVLICYHLLSLCGASPVLVLLLRVVYGLWFFFSAVFILQYIMLLMKARAVLYDKINPKNELEE